MDAKLNECPICMTKKKELNKGIEIHYKCGETSESAFAQKTKKSGKQSYFNI